MSTKVPQKCWTKIQEVVFGLETLCIILRRSISKSILKAVYFLSSSCIGMLKKPEIKAIVQAGSQIGVERDEHLRCFLDPGEVSSSFIHIKQCFKFCVILFVLERLYAKECQWRWIFHTYGDNDPAPNWSIKVECQCGI